MTRAWPAAPALLIILAAVLCTSPAWGSTVVTDDMNENVTVSPPALRIVSLAPQNTEILGALGVLDRVVGDTDYCNYPAEAINKPKVGGFSSVNVEKVVALAPDLVLAAPTNGKEVVSRLRGLGIDVIVLNPEDIGGVYHSIRLTGTVTGREKEAEDLVRSMQARLAAVQNSTACAKARPTVAHVVWYDPVWVSGTMTYQDEVIRYAGGTNAFADTPGWGTVSLEDFIVRSPDYILVNAGTGMGNATDNADPVFEYFRTDPRLSQLPAVEEGRIVLVDTDTISRGGPRIVEAVEQVAAAIHPECFAPGTQQPEATPAKLPTQAPGFTGLASGCAGVLCYLMLHARGKI